jgi:hypothetical protein
VIYPIYLLNSSTGPVIKTIQKTPSTGLFVIRKTKQAKKAKPPLKILKKVLNEDYWPSQSTKCRDQPPR